MCEMCRIIAQLLSHKTGSCSVTMCVRCVLPKFLYGNTKLSRTYKGGTPVFENVPSEG